MIGMATASGSRGQVPVRDVVGPAAIGLVGMAAGLRVRVSVWVTVDVDVGVGCVVHAANPNVADAPARRNRALARRCTLVITWPDASPAPHRCRPARDTPRSLHRPTD